MPENNRFKIFPDDRNIPGIEGYRLVCQVEFIDLGYITKDPKGKYYFEPIDDNVFWFEGLKKICDFIERLEKK